MRIAVAVLCCLLASCKDKPAEKKPAAATVAAPDPAKRVPERNRPSLETPEVTGTGVVPATHLGPKIVVSKDAISLDGDPIIHIGSDGLIDRQRLDILTHQLEDKARSDAPIAVALDATLPYRRIGVVLDALKKAGFRNLALLTGTGGTMIPLELPDASEANNGGLRPVVTIVQKRVTLWSASGEEGTKGAPKLSFELGKQADFSPLTHALAEIVQRRWPDGSRDDEDKKIIFQLDPNQPAQVLLQAAAAVRADGTLTLFPAIFLAGGV